MRRADLRRLDLWRKGVLAVAGWCAAAIVATVAGSAALGVVGEGLTGSPDRPLSPREVARALAADSTPNPPPNPSANPSADPTGNPTVGPAPRGFTTPGGTLFARCVGAAGAQVALVSWTPAQGYAVARADPGPDDHVEVRFEGAGGKVEIRVECRGGRPQADVKRD